MLPGHTVREHCAKKKPSRRWLEWFGGEEGDRTLDLRIANATLSQLSYFPKRGEDSIKLRSGVARVQGDLAGHRIEHCLRLAQRRVQAQHRLRVARLCGVDQGR